MVHHAFHIPPASSLSAVLTKILLVCKEIDFLLGISAAPINFEIDISACSHSDGDIVQPPARQTSEPAGIAATVEVAVAAVDAKQRTEASAFGAESRGETRSSSGSSGN